MADELKQIREFPNKPDFGDDDLLLLQGSGTTYNVQGRAIKRYAEDSAKPQVLLAQEAAEDAAEAATRAETAIQRPAIPDPVTGNWMVWDQTAGGYVVTEVRAEGRDFEIKGYYPTLEALEAAVPEPGAGFAYGIGTAAPYDIYVWDAVAGDWRNNGPMTASGDMLKSMYDPQHVERDVFAFAEAMGIPAGGMTGQIPVKASDTDRDVTWADPPETGVTSFKGRTGAVKPASGDYSVSQVTGAAPKYNPEFSGRISLGRKAESEPGYSSCALGDGVIASGSCSLAEGDSSSAVGAGSHAEGYETIAGNSAEPYKTKASHAEGYKSKAGTATPSSYVEAPHAEGYYTTADGAGAHSEGYDSTANGKGAHSEGFNTTSDGEGAHSEGGNSIASGNYSHSEGYNAKAAGYGAHAEGQETIASGAASHAGGLRSAATFICAFAHGQDVTADWGQAVFGRWNVISSTPFELIVGCGTSSSDRRNAFRTSENGTFGIGSFHSSGADYAELFEWADGNLERQDRAGLFVTLEGERIRLAGPGDGYILGIVSGNPSFVGDVYDDQWRGMCLTDIFGRPIMEDVEVPEVTETVEVPFLREVEGGEPVMETRLETRTVIPAHTERRQKLNPDYDRGLTYVPRSARPEWDAVGLLGKLVAVDDGSCQVNGWATVGPGGRATASLERTKYRVMSRLDDRHIRVMIL